MNYHEHHRSHRAVNSFRHLRVSLLKACNLNCSYCLPPSFESVRKSEITPVASFERAISALVRLGVRKVRFTGGEPTLYKGLGGLVSYAKSLDSDIKVALTTNGMRLSGQASNLAKRGLDSANISLDTVDRQKFQLIAQSDSLDEVMEGVKIAKRFIPKVKLNTVAIRGLNDDQFVDLVDFADQQGVDIRFIEYMPTKYGERDRRYISSEEIRESFPFNLSPAVTTPGEPARYFLSSKHSIRIGFISSVSQPFCRSCDRLRLTSDGKLYTCLFSRRSLDFFSLMEESEVEIRRTMEMFMKGKEFIAETKGLGNLPYEPSFTEIGG